MLGFRWARRLKTRGPKRRFPAQCGARTAVLGEQHLRLGQPPLWSAGLSRCIDSRPVTSMPLIVPTRPPCAPDEACIRLAHHRSGSPQAMKIKRSRQFYRVVAVRAKPVGVAADGDLIRIRVRRVGFRIYARLGVDSNEIRLATLSALRLQLFGSISSVDVARLGPQTAPAT